MPVLPWVAGAMAVPENQLVLDEPMTRVPLAPFELIPIKRALAPVPFRTKVPAERAD